MSNGIYVKLEDVSYFVNKISGGWNSQERYDTITHPKDIKKNEYCKKHNIPPFKDSLLSI